MNKIQCSVQVVKYMVVHWFEPSKEAKQLGKFFVLGIVPYALSLFLTLIYGFTPSFAWLQWVTDWLQWGTLAFLCVLMMIILVMDARDAIQHLPENNRRE